MLSTRILAVLAAVAPALVSADLGQLGFAMGSKMPNGDCKTTADYEADFDALTGATSTSLVRGYEAGDCDFAKNIIPACKSRGFKVILGIWPDTDEGWKSGSNAVQAVASQYGDDLSKYVQAVTVGSEVMYRASLTASTLNDRINDVKKMVPKIPVGTADSYTSYANGSMDSIISNPAVDLLLVNGFPFWQGATIDEAWKVFYDDMVKAMHQIESVRQDVKVWVGETGWPTTGTNYQAAQPGVDAAKKYFNDVVCTVRFWGVNIFWFEGFDEPLKGQAIGMDHTVHDETSWGAFSKDRKLKYDIHC